MKRLFKYLLVVAIGVFSVSCHKKDTAEDFPVKPYAEQYPIDLAAIDKYLDENHMDVNTTTFEVTLTKMTTTTPSSWQSIRQQTTYPLQYKTVTRDGVDYKVYYISFRDGLGTKPTRVDSTFVSYKGFTLANTSFDSAQNPTWFSLEALIPGWAEILPMFKGADSHTLNTDGSVVYNNFGAGMMFLPSGLAYYANSTTGVEAYSPLIFSFGLKDVNFIDHDGDHIDSIYEDVNGNGIFSDDDTDGDGRPNYIDGDDDGDGYLTKYEIKDGLGGYYPYSGIPDCSGDTSTPTRIRRHLDSNCHQP